MSTLEGRAYHIKHIHTLKHACSQFGIMVPQFYFPLQCQEGFTQAHNPEI
jgi:hypothetical protein